MGRDERDLPTGVIPWFSLTMTLHEGRFESKACDACVVTRAVKLFEVEVLAEAMLMVPNALIGSWEPP